MNCIYFVLCRANRKSPIRSIKVKGKKNYKHTGQLLRNKGYIVVYIGTPNMVKNMQEKGRINFLKKHLGLREEIWNNFSAIDYNDESDPIEIDKFVSLNSLQNV